MKDTEHSTLDPARLDAFLGRAVTDLSAGYFGVMISLGSRLGLYEAMAGAGPLSSREVAGRAGCAECYVREWLAANVAARCLPEPLAGLKGLAQPAARGEACSLR